MVSHQVNEMVGKEKQLVQRAERLKALLARFPNITQQKLGKVAGTRGQLPLKEGAIPVFMKARPVPYSLRSKVETELNRLEQEGVITTFTWSEWATPIVVVPKKDGTIRLCADFRMTANKALKVDKYPLPRVEVLNSSQEKIKSATCVSFSILLSTCFSEWVMC